MREAGAACTGSWSQVQLLLPPALSGAEQSLRWGELKDSLGSGLTSCLSEHSGREVIGISLSSYHLRAERCPRGTRAPPEWASGCIPEGADCVKHSANRKAITGGVQTSGLIYTLRLWRAPEGFLNQSWEVCGEHCLPWGSLCPVPRVPRHLPLPRRNVQERNHVLIAPNSKQKVSVSLSAVFLQLRNKEAFLK